MPNWIETFDMRVATNTPDNVRDLSKIRDAAAAIRAVPLPPDVGQPLKYPAAFIFMFSWVNDVGQPLKYPAAFIFMFSWVSIDRHYRRRAMVRFKDFPQHLAHLSQKAPNFPLRGVALAWYVRFCLAFATGPRRLSWFDCSENTPAN